MAKPCSRVFTALLASLGSLISGCATLDVPWVNRVPQASKKNPVVQVVCMWEASEGRDPNGAPCRGFAGQILFLGNKGGTPVAVEGDVTIYLFDDFGTEEEQAVPIHQFNFDAGAWNRHMRVGSLGPAYHCFVPYTRPGNYEATCTVRLKLTPKDGQVLTSDASHVALRGRARQGDGSTQYASRGQHVWQTSPPLDDRNSRTTTIPLLPHGSRSSDIQPASYEVEDRGRQVLEEYRRERAASEESQQTSSGRRLRLSQMVTGSEAAPATGDVPATTASVTSDPDFLSNHPLAIDGPAAPRRAHPLRDQPVDSSLTASDGHLRAEAVGASDWEPSSPGAVVERELLNGQTTVVE